MSPHFAICLAATLLTACAPPAAPPEPVRVVRTLTVQTGDDALRQEFAGEVRARHESKLGFRVGGKLVERRVDAGAVVKAGQVLAVLDAKDLALAAQSAKAQVAQAQSAFELARGDVARYTALRAQNFISEAELQRHLNTFSAAQAALDAARAQAELATNAASYATLTADTDGVITALEAEVGQVVAAGQPVMQLARAGEREIAISVPEDKLPVLRAAQRIEVSLWSAPGKHWRGVVREVAAAADPVTRTFAVRVSVEDGAPLQLGLSASVVLFGPATNGTRIRLPLSALIAHTSGSAVWVVDEKTHTVRRQPVAVGKPIDNDMLVESGLAPGQVVVTAGAHQLIDGQQVRVFGADVR